MNCQQCREVVSASLDGEAGTGERAAAEVHLVACASCLDWSSRAGRLSRLARVRPAEPVPDLAGPLLASLGIVDGAPAGGVVAPPRLTCLSGGCCDADGTEQATACGCAASCGCGCQDGAPCRCGTRAA